MADKIKMTKNKRAKIKRLKDLMAANLGNEWTVERMNVSMLSTRELEKRTKIEEKKLADTFTKEFNRFMSGMVFQGMGSQITVEQAGAFKRLPMKHKKGVLRKLI